MVVLVGAAPDLEFLETDTQLGQVPGNPIDKNNPIDIGKAFPSTWIVSLLRKKYPSKTLLHMFVLRNK